ncbi:MAG TPA: MarR family transcriptional regulator [Candidatus Baltobacteraceae bacterium]|jgi:DNA-binding MarR family transcriptional regulator|nr:MarR family transcriptional regulator [Candidatus Baltobacteraceae bacterium]
MAKIASADASIEAAVEELLRATGQLLRRLRAESSGDDLTWTQTAVLGRLAKEGPATTADLARAEAVKPQSMSASLGVLEEQGLVERRPHPTDGRQILFALTRAGVATREARSRLKRKWLASAAARLSPAELRALLGAVKPMKRLANS